MVLPMSTTATLLSSGQSTLFPCLLLSCLHLREEQRQLVKVADKYSARKKKAKPKPPNLFYRYYFYFLYVEVALKSPKGKVVQVSMDINFVQQCKSSNTKTSCILTGRITLKNIKIPIIVERQSTNNQRKCCDYNYEINIAEGY